MIESTTHAAHLDEPVVACTLAPVDLAVQARRWSELRERAQIRRVTTPHGTRLYFRADPGVVETLAELVAIENRCCSWAAWAVESRDDEAVLQVTSTGHGVEVIHGMFGAAGAS